MTATRAQPATFLRGAHQIVTPETAAARHPDPAAGDRHADLRGDPLSPEVVRIVKLIRPEPVDRGPWGDLA